jgi:hypothetical protein
MGDYFASKGASGSGLTNAKQNFFFLSELVSYSRNHNEKGLIGHLHLNKVG